MFAAGVVCVCLLCVNLYIYIELFVDVVVSLLFLCVSVCCVSFCVLVMLCVVFLCLHGICCVVFGCRCLRLLFPVGCSMLLVSVFVFCFVRCSVFAVCVFL